MKDLFHGVGTVLFVIAGIGLVFGPFITHIVWGINAAAETGSAIALLIVGVLIPPVGWIHGIALWLGFTWI